MEQKERRKYKSWNYILYSLVGLILAFLMVAVRMLTTNGNIVWTPKIFAACLGMSLWGALLGVGCCYAAYHPVKLREDSFHYRIPEKTNTFGIVWFISLILILIAWLPYFLAYYPGILSYDSYIQIGQIFDGVYNDHHPIIHTLFIKMCISLGIMLFHHVNAGIAIYCAIQSLLLAAVFAYGVSFIYCRTRSYIRMGIVLVYCLFFMFHGYMSVTVTKDSIFSIFFLLELLAFSSIISRQDTASKVKLQDILAVIGAIGITCFRNNGRYALVCVIVFALLAWTVSVIKGNNHKKIYSRILLEGTLGLVIGMLFVTCAFKITKAGQGDRREMLSIPIQQLARTMVYHEDFIDAESKSLINDFLLNESYREYRQDIADPVKRNTNTYVVRYRTMDFAKTYLQLFQQYPGDYLNAFLAVNAGFIDFGDISHATINVLEGLHGMGYVQTRWSMEDLEPYGFYKDSKLPRIHDYLEKWADANSYLQIPLLKYIFMPGIYLWISVWITLTAFTKKQFTHLIPMVLILGYYLTMFFGPTVQLRYIYPVMIFIPFALALCTCGKKSACYEKDMDNLMKNRKEM